jgi:hypothetical protein
VWLAFLALDTGVSGIPSQKKVILFERSQTITLVPMLPWITLFWHNQDSYLKSVANSPKCKLMATIFVDHHSDHIYVFLTQDLTVFETILAKPAYE